MNRGRIKVKSTSTIALHSTLNEKIFRDRGLVPKDH